MAGPSSSDAPVSTSSPFGPGVPALPDDATPEQKDQHWYQHVYQGDKMPQLTWRAVIVGGFLGMAMSAANLYTTLSIGWAFGIAITACVLSFVMWNVVVLMSGKRVSQMSVLENACMASCASAAGYSTGSTIATMFGALVLLHDVPEGTPLSSVKTWDVTAPWIVTVFTLCTGLMGVFLAIPMKRQMINHEQLPFPSGLAAAETLKSLYSKSAEALKKAYVLVIGLGAGLVLGLLRAGDDVLGSLGWLRRFFEFVQEKMFTIRVPSEIEMGVVNTLYPKKFHPAGFAFEPSALLTAAGMIVGMRISVSLVLSSLLLYAVVGPQLAAKDFSFSGPGASVVLTAAEDAGKSATTPEGARDAAVAAIEAAATKQGIPNTPAVVAAAKRGAFGALADIEDARSVEFVRTLAKECRKVGLDGGMVEDAGAKAVADAGYGPDAAAYGAGERTLRELAKAAKKDVTPMLAAVEVARAKALAAGDETFGTKGVAMVVDAAKAMQIDAARVQAAADAARAKASSNPGRAAFAAARKTATSIAYDEREMDPAPLEAAAGAFVDEEGPKADKAAADNAWGALLAEATQAQIDTKAIIQAADAARASAIAGTSRDDAAIREVTRQAQGSSGRVNADALVASARAATTPDAKKIMEQAKAVAKAAGGAAAGVGGKNWADRDALAAKEAALAQARAANATYKKTVEAGEAAYEAKKFKPNFIWAWGDTTIVLTRWSLWGGTAIMVFSSLTAVALQWRTLLRAFTGMRKEGGVDTSAQIERKLAGIEVPGMWMILGMVPITVAMVWLQIQAFEVSWYAGLIAVAMSFVLSLVACRATGETDTTPIGAMGKVMQLMFAGLAPKNVGANLASAGIAANSASSSADLLTDLKTGYMLGANPRKQFLAQFIGVFFGTIAIVPIWYLMVPTREKLEQFALPSTRAWEAVARVLTKGIGELPDSAKMAILIGALVGVGLPLLERVLPAKFRKFMPSATGIGLAWVMPFQNAFSFLVGAIIALLWKTLHKKSCEDYNIPLASGLIAGESLMAAGLAILATIAGLMASGVLPSF